MRLRIRELPGQDPAVALGNAWQLRPRNIAQQRIDLPVPAPHTLDGLQPCGFIEIQWSLVSLLERGNQNFAVGKGVLPNRSNRLAGFPIRQSDLQS